MHCVCVFVCVSSAQSTCRKSCTRLLLVLMCIVALCLRVGALSVSHSSPFLRQPKFRMELPLIRVPKKLSCSSERHITYHKPEHNVKRHKQRLWPRGAIEQQYAIRIHIIRMGPHEW